MKNYLRILDQYSKSKYIFMGIIISLIVVSLCVALLTSYSVIFADENYSLIINNEKMDDDISCVSKNGDIYLPFSKIEKKIGMQSYIEVKTGVLLLSSKKDRLLLGSISAPWGFLNGEKYTLKARLFDKDGVIYIPSGLLVDGFHIKIEKIEDRKWLRVVTNKDVMTIEQLKKKYGKEAVTQKSLTVPKKNVEQSKNVIYKAYLTFDDGIDSKITSEVLDILKENDVKATFFIVGNTIPKNKDLLKRIVEEGHAVGNHSYTHKRGIIYSSPEKMKEEIDKTFSLIHEVTGVNSILFRPPYGDLVVKSKEYEQALAGYRMVFWNVDSGDSVIKDIKGYQIAARVIDQLKRRGNAFILLHDSGTHAESVKALPIIIKYLKDNNYDIETIGQNTDLRISYGK